MSDTDELMEQLDRRNERRAFAKDPNLATRTQAWLLTYNGALVDAVDLSPEDIDPSSLIHASSIVNRYTGNTIRPYSVCEHSMHLYHYVPASCRRAALIHDWSEAMFADVPSPVKKRLPEYVRMEEAAQKVIFMAMGVTWDEMQALDYYDKMIQQDEMIQLFQKPFDLGRPGLGIKMPMERSWQDWKNAMLNAARREFPKHIF